MAEPVPALLGGSPVAPPGGDPHPQFSERALARVTELLRQGQVVGLNKGCPVVAECESALAQWHGVDHCLAVSSGHGALHSALMGLNIGPGDEVICSPYTWGASVSCVLHAGAVPVFADVYPDTGLLDPAAVAAAITPRTRALLPVHLYGQPADMTALCHIAQRHGLAVLEDGSQAHGAVHAGRKVGGFGDVGAFSCMGGKLLATTEAGYLVCDDADLYWRACLNTQHNGRSGDPGFPEALRPYVDSLIYTYRIATTDAVLLTEQLGKLDDENAGRAANVERLKQHLRGLGSISFPTFAADDQPAYHMLSVNFVPEHAGLTRDTYLRALQAEGVGVWAYVPAPVPHWRRMRWQDYDGPAIHWINALAESGLDYANQSLPNCEHKVAHSIELGWNYIADDPDRMARLAEAFWKVEHHLDALRAWEREVMPVS